MCWSASPQPARRPALSAPAALPGSGTHRRWQTQSWPGSLRRGSRERGAVCGATGCRIWRRGAQTAPAQVWPGPALRCALQMTPTAAVAAAACHPPITEAWLLPAVTHSTRHSSAHAAITALMTLPPACKTMCRPGAGVMALADCQAQQHKPPKVESWPNSKAPHAPQACGAHCARFLRGLGSWKMYAQCKQRF